MNDLDHGIGRWLHTKLIVSQACSGEKPSQLVMLPPNQPTSAGLSFNFPEYVFTSHLVDRVKWVLSLYLPSRLLCGCCSCRESDI